MSKYRTKKESNRYYIQKKGLFGWFKVPDTGFGWKHKSMQYIEGCNDLGVAEQILDHYLEKQQNEIYSRTY